MSGSSVAPAGTNGWAKRGKCGYAVVSYGCCSGSGSGSGGCGSQLPRLPVGGTIHYFADTPSYLGAVDCMSLALADTSITEDYTVISYGTSDEAAFASAVAGAEPSTDLVIFMLVAGDSSSVSTAVRDELVAWRALGGRTIGSLGGVDHDFAMLFGVMPPTPAYNGFTAREFAMYDVRFSAGVVGNDTTISDQGGLIGGAVWFDHKPDGNRACLVAVLNGPPDAVANGILVGNTDLGADGYTIWNCFLQDSFDDTAKGAQLYLNELNYILGIV